MEVIITMTYIRGLIDIYNGYIALPSTLRYSIYDTQYRTNTLPDSHNTNGFRGCLLDFSYIINHNTYDFRDNIQQQKNIGLRLNIRLILTHYIN